MSWSSFIKNILGGTDSDNSDDAVQTGVRNLNLSGRAFKKELEGNPDAVLLDVRTQGEFFGGTIPGSKNLDFLSPAFALKIQNLDKNVTYFLFCRSGNRSAKACRMMHKQGFDVRNLDGGIGSFPN